MNFGNYAIISDIEHRFKKEPDWTWTIKPPTSGAEFEINRFLVQGRTQVGPDGIQREFPPTFTEIAYREIALLFGGTNIPEGGKGSASEKPILKPTATVAQVEAVLRDMPHEMVMEIWGAIADAVPGWGPRRPK